MRKRARALSLCFAAVVLVALSGSALGAVSQRSVQLDASLVEIDLAAGNTAQLTGKVLPEGASQDMVWRSGDKSVAEVSKTGLITARRIGSTTVSARPSTRSAWTRTAVRVIDTLAPASLALNVRRLGLRIGGSFQLESTVLPETSVKALRFTSSRSSVASVSETGLITAKRTGTAVIRAISARNPALYRSVVLTVKRLPLPRKLTITPETRTVNLNETLQLSFAVSPSSANPSVAWSSGNRAVATVDQTGLVTAKAVGTARIRVRSKAKRTVYTIRTLKVVDPYAVTSVTIESGGSVLLEGGKLTLSALVLPATAPQTVTWSSNNESVAKVSADGEVSGISVGSATITAAAGGKSTQQRVVVLDETPVTDLPSQITSAAGINGNFARIDDILRYATAQLDALEVSGAIRSSEAKSRKTILLNAFRMARFPWMSPKTVVYWSGGSRYQKNVVYFGLPYTQANRTYNVSKSLRAGAFKQLGDDAYYTAYLADKSYPGNDCSSFVSISQWGLGTKYSLLRSWEMKTSSAYKTVATRTRNSGYQNLRPGDFFVRNGHVAMFLYYADSLHRRIMILQQGGLDSLNTVSCTLKPLTFYSQDSRYIARRKRAYA